MFCAEVINDKSFHKFDKVYFEIRKKYKLYSGHIDSIPFSAVFQKSTKF